MTEESSTSGLACQALDEVETEVLRLVSETHRGLQDEPPSLPESLKEGLAKIRLQLVLSDAELIESAEQRRHAEDTFEQFMTQHRAAAQQAEVSLEELCKANICLSERKTELLDKNLELRLEVADLDAQVAKMKKERNVAIRGLKAEQAARAGEREGAMFREEKLARSLRDAEAKLGETSRDLEAAQKQLESVQREIGDVRVQTSLDDESGLDWAVKVFKVQDDVEAGVVGAVDDNDTEEEKRSEQAVEQAGCIGNVIPGSARLDFRADSENRPTIVPNSIAECIAAIQGASQGRDDKSGVKVVEADSSIMDEVLGHMLDLREALQAQEQGDAHPRKRSRSEE